MTLCLALIGQRSPARVALIGLGAAHGLVEAGRRAPGRGLEVGDECVARTKIEVVLLHLQQHFHSSESVARCIHTFDLIKVVLG